MRQSEVGGLEHAPAAGQEGICALLGSQQDIGEQTFAQREHKAEGGLETQSFQTDRPTDQGAQQVLQLLLDKRQKRSAKSS